MNVVFLVCHADDAGLGAGGRAQRLLEASYTIDIIYVTEDYTYHPEDNYDTHEAAQEARACSVSTRAASTSSTSR
ncbi:hypothetical protein [Halorubrum sp. Atlit-8R]|uniref:hypothetical protein n=1 Tax=Halorubrum sp. Atlit-8R TaxID=2282126 RepID=UPI0011C34FD6|nr:hypothetical protein [Halorubrum sp. Atlit-8R]